jgi:hypothetical protein
MPKPFMLKRWRKNLSALKPSARERLLKPMKNQARECEWLWEATSSSPEQSLSIAVLQRAVLDIITPGVQERDRLDAEMWINGQLGQEFEESYAMSFSRIVQSFTDMPVEEFRAKLQAWVNIAKVSKENADGFRFQRS